MIFAVLSIGVGWVNLPGVDAFSKFLHYGEYHEEAFNWGIAGASLVVALLGITLSALFYWKRVFSADQMAVKFRPLYLLLKNKYYFDEMYGWAMGKIYFGFAGLCTWFDDHIVDDGMVDGTGWITEKMGGLLRLTQTGYVQNYALVIFGSVAAIYLFVSF